MDELFRDHPLFVPGSTWQPSSQLEDHAREIAKRDQKAGSVGAVEHIEQVV